MIRGTSWSWASFFFEKEKHFTGEVHKIRYKEGDGQMARKKGIHCKIQSFFYEHPKWNRLWLKWNKCMFQMNQELNEKKWKCKKK